MSDTPSLHRRIGRRLIEVLYTASLRSHRTARPDGGFGPPPLNLTPIDIWAIPNLRSMIGTG